MWFRWSFCRKKKLFSLEFVLSGSDALKQITNKQTNNSLMRIEWKRWKNIFISSQCRRMMQILAVSPPTTTFISFHIAHGTIFFKEREEEENKKKENITCSIRLPHSQFITFASFYFRRSADVQTDHDSKANVDWTSNKLLIDCILIICVRSYDNDLSLYYTFNEYRCILIFSFPSRSIATSY